MSTFSLTSLAAFKQQNPNLNLEFGLMDEPIEDRNFYFSFDHQGETWEIKTSLTENDLLNEHNQTVFESNIVDDIRWRIAGCPKKWNEWYNLIPRK